MTDIACPHPETDMISAIRERLAAFGRRLAEWRRASKRRRVPPNVIALEMQVLDDLRLARVDAHGALDMIGRRSDLPPRLGGPLSRRKAFRIVR